MTQNNENNQNFDEGISIFFSQSFFLLMNMWADT